MPNPSPHAKDPVLIALGSAIRVARLERGISQEDLGAQAEISRAHMSKIERGRTNPQVMSIRRMAEVMGMTLAELFSKARL
jgi:transcriptional regulator with XRE-family HTH domain